MRIWRMVIGTGNSSEEHRVTFHGSREAALKTLRGSGLNPRDVELAMILVPTDKDGFLKWLDDNVEGI